MAELPQTAVEFDMCVICISLKSPKLITLCSLRNFGLLNLTAVRYMYFLMLLDRD